MLDHEELLEEIAGYLREIAWIPKDLQENVVNIGKERNNAASSALTEADIIVQEAFLRRLKQYNNQIRVIAEEDSPYKDEFVGDELTVVDDPIDWTFGYVKKLNTYCHVSSIQKNNTLLGVAVYRAQDEKNYCATRGRVWIIDKEGRQKEYTQPNCTSNILFVGGLEDFEVEKLSKKYDVKIAGEVKGLHACDGQHSLNHILTSQIAGYLCRNASELDWGSIPLITKVGGGVVCDFSGKEIDFHYTTKNGEFKALPSIIAAANKEVKEDILAALK